MRRTATAASAASFNQLSRTRWRDNELLRYFCTAGRANDPSSYVIDLSGCRWVTAGLLRWAGQGRRDFAAREIFDRRVANALSRESRVAGAEVVALDGVALHTIEAAKRLGSGATVVEATTSHADNVARQHSRAVQEIRIEASWLTSSHKRKLRREYDLADSISVPSLYAWASFVDSGVPEAKLVRRTHRLAPRFAPPLRREASDVFTLIYVGRLEQAKGIKTLLDAFAHLRRPDLRLVLVGRFATSSMHRFVAERCVGDSRIAIAAGDPLHHLHRAELFVHPSFEDGLAFAPLEALAAGVPVVVTEDTGMKEYVEPHNGVIVPTGDVAALVDTIAEVIEHPLSTPGIRSLLPAALESHR